MLASMSDDTKQIKTEAVEEIAQSKPSSPKRRKAAKKPVEEPKAKPIRQAGMTHPRRNKGPLIRPKKG